MRAAEGAETVDERMTLKAAVESLLVMNNNSTKVLAAVFSEEVDTANVMTACSAALLFVEQVVTCRAIITILADALLYSLSLRTRALDVAGTTSERAP